MTILILLIVAFTLPFAALAQPRSGSSDGGYGRPPHGNQQTTGISLPELAKEWANAFEIVRNNTSVTVAIGREAYQRDITQVVRVEASGSMLIVTRSNENNGRIRLAIRADDILYISAE